jgi:hypothetical protein
MYYMPRYEIKTYIDHDNDTTCIKIRKLNMHKYGYDKQGVILVLSKELIDAVGPEWLEIISAYIADKRNQLVRNLVEFREYHKIYLCKGDFICKSTDYLDAKNQFAKYLGVDLKYPVGYYSPK